MSYADLETNRVYNRRWYAEHRDQEQARSRRRQRQIRARIAAIKGAPCADCGARFPAEAMDFDHVRGVKKFKVSHICNRSWSSIAAEIANCDLVCANCHRIRTSERRK